MKSAVALILISSVSIANADNDPVVELGVGANQLVSEPTTTQVDVGLGFGVSLAPNRQLLLRGRAMLGETISSALALETRFLGGRHAFGFGPTVISVDDKLALGLGVRRSIAIVDHVFAALEVRTAYILTDDWLVDASVSLGVSR